MSPLVGGEDRLPDLGQRPARVRTDRSADLVGLVVALLSLLVLVAAGAAWIGWWLT